MPLSLMAIKALLKGQTAAAQHMEICTRCQRLFVAALEVSDETDPMFFREGAFGITAKVIRDLRDCAGWPSGA